jgi:hypothetical protein
MTRHLFFNIEMTTYILNQLESFKVNLSNLQPRSWDYYNLVENKFEKNYETQFSTNPILKDEIEK